MFRQLLQRVLPASITSDREREIRHAVRELRSLSNHELSDLGIPRSQIEQCVRYGRPGVDHHSAPTDPMHRTANPQAQNAAASNDAFDHRDLAA